MKKNYLQSFYLTTNILYQKLLYNLSNPNAVSQLHCKGKCFFLLAQEADIISHVL